MGKYVPPEYEGVYSHNQIAGKHALGSRANKSSQGILTVRFEMPYPVWCTHCPKPTIIGQGVRFNAEKKKVGNYYSTPIYSFRMKHIACGGWIEIRTDPKNTAYVVIEGARRRDTGDDKVEEGDVRILTVAEREKLRSDAFASLEGKVEDKKRLDGARQRLEELQDVQDTQWEDPYEQNRRLRNVFRVGRKQRERDAHVTGALQERMSLGIDLLPESDEDAKRAGYISFGGAEAHLSRSRALSRPLFSASDTLTKLQKAKQNTKKKIKVEEIVERRKADFAAEVRSNTRAKMDPFLGSNLAAKSSRGATLGIKRKREAKDIEISGPETPTPTNTLVDYRSD